MAATAASDVSDGPVLSLINKRLRGLRKKYNRILQMEESLSKGKTLNKEQEETFSSKPSVVAAIDELEKLRQPLSAAVSEEINLSIQHHQVSAADKKLAECCDSKTENQNGISMLEDLLNVIYFGNMFGHLKWQQQSEFVPTMLKRTMHERACCLNYDCMPEDESTQVVDLLSEKDLDLIAMLSEQLISRPVNSTLSHKHAIQKCIEHANLWLTKSDQPIRPESDATYAGLRLKLDKVMSSLYFTTDPVFKVEEAVSDYGAYHVPVEEPVGGFPVDASVQVDAPALQYQEKEEEFSSYQGDETNEIQGGTVEELQQVDDLSKQPAEEVAPERDVKNIKDADFKDKQSVSRRTYRNYKGNRGGGGGGRRGYSNGRGRGCSYQNSRNQYYDQSDNHYQKNYYNYRGRGTHAGGNHGQYASGGQAGNIYAVS